MPAKVLMLDDDPSLVRLVKLASEREGWSMESAGTAAQALPAAKRFLPDIILLDVDFPDGDGFSVCRGLRAEPALAKIPVIFLTRRGDVESRVKGFEAGGQDYVAKPFAVEELVARTRAHLALKGRLDDAARRVEDLSVKDRLRQDLVDTFVHDLRAPLGSIRVALSLLEETGAVSGAEHALLMRCAEDASEFAIIMVNDLLDLGSGQVRIKPAALDLKALADKLRAMFMALLERHRIELKLELAPDLPSLVTDPMLVFRVLANLFSNAIKFSKDGQRVTLRAQPLEKGLRLEVIDQGPGIPDAEKAKLFNKYYRADTEISRAVPGTGIGLAFCRMAVAQLGGAIDIQDAPGGGSLFFVELPESLPASAAGAAQALPPELMDEYRKECREKLALAKQALAALSPEKLRAVAHQLAGSAGSHGLNDAGRTAAELEALAAEAAKLGALQEPSLSRARELAARLESELGV